MSILTGKGNEIAEKFNKQSEENEIDFKKVKINKDLKKENDSIRVRLLGAEDFSTYEAHADFNKDIWTAPCIKNLEGERCLYCEAAKHEGWTDLGSKTRFLFAFYDIDLEMLRYLEVSFGQGKALMGSIAEYAENIEEIAFNLKRVGSGTKTSYALSPILKLKGDDQEKFDAVNGEKVPEDFLEKVLYVKNANQMGADLEKKGFDVQGILGFTVEAEETEQGEVKENTGEAPDPSKVF